jgi:hypothetical protein
MSRSFVYYAVAVQKPSAGRADGDRMRRARPKPSEPERRPSRSIAQRLSFTAPLVARLSHRA